VGVTVLFFTGLAVIAVWWLSSQRLTSKPWLEQGSAGEFPNTGVSGIPIAKVGLGVLLATVGSLFALFISAYLMRMQLVDWRPVPKPTLLWLNTGLLILSSAALQWGRALADRGAIQHVRLALLGAGVAAILFIIGQGIAWRQLDEAGYFLTSNPANSFFFLVTALHGLHVLGGLVALGRNIVRAWQGRELAKLRLGIDLCSLYWDFLLLMWLVLFGLLLLR
jgi:cytochrome c oxidase subunit III